MLIGDMERELFQSLVPPDKITARDMSELYTKQGNEYTNDNNNVTQSQLSESDISAIADAVIKKLSSPATNNNSGDGSTVPASDGSTVPASGGSTVPASDGSGDGSTVPASDGPGN